MTQNTSILLKWEAWKASFDHYPTFGRTKPRHAPGHLRLHDIAEAVRVCARLLGLFAVSEYEVLEANGKRLGRLDYVICRREDGTPVAAIEIEGREVNEGSLHADRAKFLRIDVQERFLLLFSVDHDLGEKGRIPRRWGERYRERAAEILDLRGVHVLMDTDVWNGDLLRILANRLSSPAPMQPEHPADRATAAPPAPGIRAGGAL